MMKLSSVSFLNRLSTIMVMVMVMVIMVPMIMPMIEIMMKRKIANQASWKRLEKESKETVQSTDSS